MPTAASSSPSIKSELVFRPDDHTYWVGGVRKRSVTEVLSRVRLVDYSFIPSDIRDYALGRGSRVHRASLYLIEGALDWDSVDDTEKGYVESCAQLLTDPGLDVEVISSAAELALYEPSLDYCGTPDAPGFYQGRYAVIDWCCGDLELAGKRYQTAGYERLLRIQPPDAWYDFAPTMPIARVGVRLRKDGKLPKPDPYTDPSDWFVFQAALTVDAAQRRIGARGRKAV